MKFGSRSNVSLHSPYDQINHSTKSGIQVTVMHTSKFGWHDLAKLCHFFESFRIEILCPVLGYIIDDHDNALFLRFFILQRSHLQIPKSSDLYGVRMMD